MSSCVGSFYFWQAVATFGFCHYLRRLGAKFPPQIPVDVGITTEQLLERKENSLAEAATKNDELEKQNALLRAKVDRLEKGAGLQFQGPIRARKKNMHTAKQARGLSVMASIQGRI